MKCVVGENGRNPVKNLPRPHFVHHETHMEGPRRELGTPAVGGERLTACATRPLIKEYLFKFKDCAIILDKKFEMGICSLQYSSQFLNPNITML